MAEPGQAPAGQDASVAELMHQLSEQVSALVHQEVALAKAELSAKGKQAGLGIGMFGGAGASGLYALGALIAAIIAALSLGVASWLAALIVTVVLGAIAGVLALQGRNKLQSAIPPAPELTVASVKQDAETIKRRAQEARATED